QEVPGPAEEMMRFALIAALFVALPSMADEVSLRLAGKEVDLTPRLRKDIAALARQALERCGPNTARHPGNFGLAALGVETRWKQALEGSRLRVLFAEPFVSES